MDIATHRKHTQRKLLVFFAVLIFFITNQLDAQNLLVNGDFESGISGTGFQTQSPYNYLSTLSGNSNPGDYAIITDPHAMNTTWFLHCKDHTSGTGKMMVIDGVNVGGQQRFWKAGNSGGGVGPLTVGTTYTFSYWVRSISTSVTDINTTANIGVAFNNASNVTLTAGNTVLPFDTSTGWVQVKYTFVPTNAYVNIEMYDNISSGTGNDFALDDIAVLAPPLPLAVSYSLQNPTCYNNTDGFIVAYGSGGTTPYTYSFDGGAFSTTNTLSGLTTSAHTVTVKDALLNTVTSSTINIVAPANPLTATASVNPICAGTNTQLTATGGGVSYNWTALPVDATLTTPNIYNPIVSPAASTAYTVVSTTTSNVNLIYNGDFSLGNVGFTTDYTYKTVNTNGAQRAYGVMPNAKVFFPTFDTCGDHTTGTANMMVVDGSLNSADKVWCQTVVVQPGTTYTFSYWIQTLTINNPAQILTKINGVAATGISANPANAPASIACGAWQKITYTWTAGAGVTTAQICLYDANVNASGNDFALDDISFTGAYSCNCTKSITVNVNPPSTTNTINLFDCNTVPYKGHNYTADTTINDTLKAIQGCDSIYNVVHITVGMRTAYAYITNYWSNSVSVINTISNVVVATITVGINPSGVGVSYDGSIVYVNNSGSNSVNVITTSNNTVLTTIPVGTQPNLLALSPDGTKLYVANSQSNNLSIINTASNTVIATVTVGNSPGTICVSPDGMRVYVSNYNNNTVSVINSLLNTVIATIFVGTNPQGVNVSPDGTKLYVANGGSNTVNVINTSNYSIIATITVGNYPNQIIVSPDGTKLYVANLIGNTVSVINTSNNAVVSTIYLVASPWGMDISPDGTRLYITSSTTNELKVISTLNNTLIATIPVGNGPDQISIFNVRRTATNNTTNLNSCKSIIYKGNTYNTSTVLKDTLHSVMGCDSIYNTVNININPITPAIKTQTFASCKAIVYNGNTYNTSTVLKDTLHSVMGCDSVYNTVKININPITPATISQTLTSCKAIVYNGNTYNASKVLKDTVKSVQGCDSVYNIVNINIGSIATTTNNVTATGCGSVTYKGNTYLSSIVLRDTVKTLQGCDSIYNVATITVNPNIPIPTGTVSSQPTCTMPSGTIDITAPTGANYVYSVDGTNYQAATTFTGLNPNTYAVTVKDTSTGCVSTALSLTVNAVAAAPAAPIATVTQQPTCNDPTGAITLLSPVGANYVYSIDGVNYQNSLSFQGIPSATYLVTVKDITTNCISPSLSLVVDTIPTVPTPTAYVTIQPICSNPLGTFIVSSPHGSNYSYYLNAGAISFIDTTFANYFSGVYSITVLDLITGCTSQAFDITLDPYIPVTPTSQTQTFVSCKAIVYNGHTYNTTTVVKDTVKSYQGCDSVYNTVNININPITPKINITTLPTNCKAIVYNGNTYNASTVLRDTVKSFQGCDSVYNIVNININPITPATITKNVNGCKAIVYNANTYNNSTVLKDTVKSFQGCDSVYNIVNININPITPITNTTTLPTSCKAIVYNGHTYNASTVLKDTLKSVGGCDSVYNVVNININPITPTINITSLPVSCKSIVYNGNTYNTSTVVRDTVKSYQGCDSIYNVFNITVKPIIPVTHTQTLASCKTIVYNGNAYNTSSVLKDTVKSFQGCDSVYSVVKININPIIPITNNINVNGCDSVIYKGISYTASTVFVDTVRNASGCDSAYKITNITVYPVPTIDAGNDVFVQPNSSVTLNPTITNTATISWSPANYLDDATSNDPVCTPLTDQAYIIKATSSDGCWDTASLKVFIIKPIKVPNVFSPNNDGINDTWDIENLEYYPFATVEIFNRYGQLLKSSRAHKKVWDGMYNGNPVPIATYYYIIRLTPASQPISGSVTVLR